MKKGTCHSDKSVALRRIEGQIRGVLRMIDEGRYCIDILNALHAARGAISRVESRILKDHMEECVKSSFEEGTEKDRQEKIDEIIKLLGGTR